MEKKLFGESPAGSATITGSTITGLGGVTSSNVGRNFPGASNNLIKNKKGSNNLIKSLTSGNTGGTKSDLMSILKKTGGNANANKAKGKAGGNANKNILKKTSSTIGNQ